MTPAVERALRETLVENELLRDMLRRLCADGALDWMDGAPDCVFVDSGWRDLTPEQSALLRAITESG